MDDGNAFALKFLKLLNESRFPENFDLEDVLRQQHTIVTALNNRVLAVICAGQHSQLLAQGLKGGGGPHRLDLLLHFSADAGEKTLNNTSQVLGAVTHASP